MRALKIIKDRSEEIAEHIRATSCTREQLRSWFLDRFEDELDEYSLDNLGIIDKHLGELIHHTNKK